MHVHIYIYMQCGCRMFAIMEKIVTVEIIPDSMSMFEFALPLCSGPSAFSVVACFILG